MPETNITDLPPECLELLHPFIDKHGFTVLARVCRTLSESAQHHLYRNPEGPGPLLQFLHTDEESAKNAPFDITQESWSRFILFCNKVHHFTYTENKESPPPETIIQQSEWIHVCRPLLADARDALARRSSQFSWDDFQDRPTGNFLPNLRSFKIDCTNAEMLAVVLWLPQESADKPHPANRLTSLSIRIDGNDSPNLRNEIYLRAHHAIFRCPIQRLSLPIDLISLTGSPLLTELTLFPAISEICHAFYMQDAIETIGRSPNLQVVSLPFNLFSAEFLQSLSDLHALEVVNLLPPARGSITGSNQPVDISQQFNNINHLFNDGKLVNFAHHTRVSIPNSIVTIGLFFTTLDITITDDINHLDFGTLRPLLECNTLEEIFIRHPFPLALTNENILQIQRSWRNANCISLNPRPQLTWKTTTLPTLECLCFLVDFHQLKFFAAYLNPAAKYAPKNYGISGARDCSVMDFELDLGKSETDGLCRNGRQTAAYIRNLFPLRRLKLTTEGNSDWVKSVASMLRDCK